MPVTKTTESMMFTAYEKAGSEFCDTLQSLCLSAGQQAALGHQFTAALGAAQGQLLSEHLVTARAVLSAMRQAASSPALHEELLTIKVRFLRCLSHTEHRVWFQVCACVYAQLARVHLIHVLCAWWDA